jgi:hypothetical protein
MMTKDKDKSGGRFGERKFSFSRYLGKRASSYWAQLKAHIGTDRVDQM